MLNIGEIIDKLKKCDVSKDVRFDFGGCIPARVASWRGSYDMPALGWKPTGYTGEGSQISVPTLLKELTSAVLGKEFTGWKGGTFCYSILDDLYVDNPGDCSHTVITSIEETLYEVIIHTTIEEY